MWGANNERSVHSQNSSRSGGVIRCFGIHKSISEYRITNTRKTKKTKLDYLQSEVKQTKKKIPHAVNNIVLMILTKNLCQSVV